MPEKIDLTGFTLFGGDGMLSIGLADKSYTLEDEVIDVIQEEAQKEKYDVTVSADTKKGLLTLIVGKAAQAVSALISFILKVIRESGYDYSVAT